MIAHLVRRGEASDEIELASGTLASGEPLQVASADERVAVVFTGIADVHVDGADLGTAGGRTDPIAEPGHAIYVPPGATLELVPRPGGASVAIIGARPGAAPAGPARVIPPGDQPVHERGRGNWARTLRTMVGADDAASRLMVGETINPPGNWSSYPPHKHDEHALPDEERFEELYYYKFSPPGGFGVQLRYEPGVEEAVRIHDGDVTVVRSGYHPVVAAPGYALYYLWALAGDSRELVPRFEPAHAWVQDES